jgi:VanZ family protein
MRTGDARPADAQVGGTRPGAGKAGGLLALLRAAGRWLLRVPRPLGLVGAFGWAGLIWFLSSLEPRQISERITLGHGFNNLLHAPEFGMLALLLALASPRAGGWVRFDRVTLRTVFALVMLYALIDELHQARTPGRDASALDLLTDAAGAAATLWIAAYVGRPDARQGELVRRLAWGLAACVSAAALATLGALVAPDVAWL